MSALKLPTLTPHSNFHIAHNIRIGVRQCRLLLISELVVKILIIVECQKLNVWANPTLKTRSRPY